MACFGVACDGVSRGLSLYFLLSWFVSRGLLSVAVLFYLLNAKTRLESRSRKKKSAVAAPGWLATRLATPRRRARPAPRRLPQPTPSSPPPSLLFSEIRHNVSYLPVSTEYLTSNRLAISDGKVEAAVHGSPPARAEAFYRAKGSAPSRARLDGAAPPQHLDGVALPQPRRRRATPASASRRPGVAPSQPRGSTEPCRPSPSTTCCPGPGESMTRCPSLAPRRSRGPSPTRRPLAPRRPIPLVPCRAAILPHHQAT